MHNLCAAVSKTEQNHDIFPLDLIYGEAFLFFRVGGVFSELALFRGTLVGTGGICLSGAVRFLLLLTDLVKQEIQRLCQINTVQVGPIYVGFMVHLVDHNVVYNFFR